MNTTDVPSLVSEMRVLTGKVKLIELSGSLKSEEEVDAKSFVQVIESVPVVKGLAEPVTWRYHQFWLDKAPAETQKTLIGRYINEKIGHEKVGIWKIIGIFSLVGTK